MATIVVCAVGEVVANLDPREFCALVIENQERTIDEQLAKALYRGFKRAKLLEDDNDSKIEAGVLLEVFAASVLIDELIKINKL
jgi:hypothetical protein